ncbi:TPA: bacterial Ig-like domain-containing protein [Enterococcus faecalis]|nr:bacterial Ig-like domain-containing protein [Enterococcus faecalis]
MKRKMRKTLYSILIYIYFFYGTVSFAETANIITTEQSEKYEDSTYNIFKQTPVIMVQDPYFVIEGDKFSFRDIFIGLIDENGNSAPFEKVKFYWINNSIDTSKVGSTAEVGYSYSYSEGDVKGSSKVIVKKDRTSIKAKDFTMYEGDPNSVIKHSFVSATDEEGNPIYWDDPRITHNWFGDKEKPGVYSAVLFLKGKFKMVSSEYFKITVKKDRSSISTKSSTLYIGQKWNPKDNFVTATDEEGKFFPYEDSRVTVENANEVDTSKPGIYKIKYTFKGKLKNVYSYAQVTVKKDQTKAELKDTELYVGQKWDLGSVFKNVVDKDGNPIKLEEVEYIWIDGKKTREIDTSKPGKHTVQIAVLKANNEWVYSNKVTVTVKEDQTKAELKDTELYVGQKWDLGSVFKNVVDKDENPIKPEEVECIWIDGQEKVREIDTSKPGKHIVEIAVLNAYNKWVNSNKITVTVKENQTKAELKDTELYVGQKWDLGSVFKYAVDKDGNPIKLEQVPWVRINEEWIDLRENKTKELIDTSKPGKHEVQICVANGYGDQAPWEYSNIVTVTVTEEPFTIKQVPYFNFEDHALVSINKSVVNKKENPTIDLETPSIMGKDWQLQVELSPFLDKKNSKSILKGVSLYIPKGKLESDLETEEPTQYDCQLEANGKASILMHGTKTKGKGRWKNKLATKEITLSIPPENKKGNYESTLHWTLLDVPG